MQQEDLNSKDFEALAEYRHFKTLRQGYKQRLASGYYAQTDECGRLRTDLHDEYDAFVAYKNEKIMQRRPKLEDPSDIEYAQFRKRQQGTDETFLASAPLN